MSTTHDPATPSDDTTPISQVKEMIRLHEQAHEAHKPYSYQSVTSLLMNELSRLVRLADDGSQGHG